jgi:hypothetical protein
MPSYSSKPQVGGWKQTISEGIYVEHLQHNGYHAELRWIPETGSYNVNYQKTPYGEVERVMVGKQGQDYKTIIALFKRFAGLEVTLTPITEPPAFRN